ncbi:hypothetical protein [Haloglycomyces albus]|uniref:hypothetical protein n=1 Tax=Haloglycomyces albus TaxID=526067 RepID=UPI00046D27B7|nr:hypothetical protein [Haloglycomyces albus]
MVEPQADKPTSPPGGGGVLSIQGRLWEWHAMDETTRQECWDDLVAWVAWLADVYELGRESRLPACWSDHPGLVQELWTLKLWRDALYTTDVDEAVTTGSEAGALAQHARQWHSELRNLINAMSFYAPQCRAGHTPAPRLNDRADDLTARWTTADPTGDIAAPRQTHHAQQRIERHRRPARRDVMSFHDMMSAGIANKIQRLNSTISDIVFYLGHWWVLDDEASEWLKCTDPHVVAQINKIHHATTGPDDTHHTTTPGEATDDEENSE